MKSSCHYSDLSEPFLVFWSLNSIIDIAGGFLACSVRAKKQLKCSIVRCYPLAFAVISFNLYSFQ